MKKNANVPPSDGATSDATVDRYPLVAIRKHCLDCSSGSIKEVKHCPCDGVHSTRCFLWPFRFGKRPKTAAKKYGAEFLDPAAMHEDEKEGKE